MLTPAILCVISEMVLVISSFCLFRTVRCLNSISSRSYFSFCIMMSISLCKSSPWLSISVVSFWEFSYRSVFWTRIMDAISWYLGKKILSSSCKSFWMISFLLSITLVISIHLWPLCSSKERHVAQIGVSHCSQ